MDHPVSNHGFKIKEGKMGADYTNSAENLCNPPEVGLKLRLLHDVEASMAELEAALAGHWAWTQLKEKQALAETVKAQIKDMVDAQGSYQDLETGDYAVKYRRMTKTYHVEPFKRGYERFIPAVIEETINVKALEGLVKGGLISGDDLKHPDIGVITETAAYAYYIR